MDYWKDPSTPVVVREIYVPSGGWSLTVEATGVGFTAPTFPVLKGRVQVRDGSGVRHELGAGQMLRLAPGQTAAVQTVAAVAALRVSFSHIDAQRSRCSSSAVSGMSCLACQSR